MATAAWFGEHLASTVIAMADYFTVSKQFYLVSIAAQSTYPGGTVGATLNTTLGAGGLKVLVNAPKAGDPAFLWDIGETKVVAGAAITAGGPVMSDSSGRVVPFIAVGSNVPIGEARMAAVNVGDIITCFMFPTPNVDYVPPFSAQGNITAATTPGVTITAEMANVSTGVSSGIVVMPPAVAGAVFFFADGQGATHGTAITPAGTDTIRGGSPGTITTAAAHETYIFFCSHTGNWEYVKSA